jgi:ABC-type Fe3+ transport system substrate-binding protein
MVVKDNFIDYSIKVQIADRPGESVNLHAGGFFHVILIARHIRGGKQMNEQLRILIDSLKLMGEEDDLPHQTNVDLLLYAPCPVKLVMKDRIDRIIDRYRKQNIDVMVHVPMGCTSVDAFDSICLETDPDKLPAVIASIGFGDFWKKEFVDRFVRCGVFEAALPPAVNPMYKQAGMIDPRGCYTIYGVTPYIFLVDSGRLGSLPVPRTWKDLLDPRYRNEIVMCGDGDDMADAVVLNIYKENGIEGLRRLAGNVKGIMHSSRMAQIAGSADPEAAAIFIIPHFFAESAKRPAHVRTVWPDDGAAVSPLYFLAKKSERERLDALISFFTRGFSAIDSAYSFAPIGETDLSALPANAKLKWIGWQFIEEHNINSLRDELNATFRAFYRDFR